VGGVPELDEVLRAHLHEITDRIIATAIHPDKSAAETRSPGALAAPETAEDL